MLGTVILAAADADDGKCHDSIVVCAAKATGSAVSNAAGAVGNAVTGVKDAAGNAINTAKGIADFWSDPAGNTFNMLQSGAKSLSDTVMPAITKATLPDLTADWFINAYKVSFALAIFVMVALIIPQVVRTARGQQSGRDLAESLGLYAPLFLIGAAFGPLLGSFLVKFFGALSDSLISWGINSSSQTIVDKFSKMLDAKDNGAGLAGGAIVGALLMFFMICGLLIVVLILIVQLITLYFSGILFPLGFVWIIDKSKRKFGSKIAYLWFGILASHPLLFFMLAIAYSMVSSSVDVFSKTPTLERTVTLVVSILALIIAGLSPVLLTKFAPVLPMGGGGGAPAGPTIGSSSMQEADAKYGDSGSGGGGGGGSSAGSSSSSKGSPASTTSDDGGSAGEETASAGSKAASASNGAETAAAGAKVGAGASAAGGGAAAAEGGAMAAGAAESSTGVGAAIGIPTMIAAGAKAGFDTTKKVGDSVGAAAVEPVEDHEEHYGKDSTHE
jgi:type IV secretion system protein TrbL